MLGSVSNSDEDVMVRATAKITSASTYIMLIMYVGMGTGATKCELTKTFLLIASH